MTKGDDLMEIKQFNVLSTLQKRELYNFIQSTDLTYNKTYIEMIKIYESDTFNEGNSVFILFHGGKIKGSAAVITKEIDIKGEAFITDIYVQRKNISNEDIYLNNTLNHHLGCLNINDFRRGSKRSHKCNFPFSMQTPRIEVWKFPCEMSLKVLNTEIFLQFLIERAFEYCNICNARSVKIGVRESETHLIPYINKLGFMHIYNAVVMGNRKVEKMVLQVNNEMELIPLSIFNSQDYMNIQNEAFKNSPNGGTIDEVEVKDYIVKYANNEDLIGIGIFEKKPCGIYELSIDENTGWIDILAIAPRYQNKGLGKALLAKCIKKLYEKNIDEIKLLVITSNDIAVKMYKEIGFEEEKVFSYWFEKNI